MNEIIYLLQVNSVVIATDLLFELLEVQNETVGAAGKFENTEKKISLFS